MKKLSRQNKIVVGVLALFLVLMVGYAVFSESLSIGGSSSTGSNDFNIVFNEVGNIEEHSTHGTTANILNSGKSLEVNVPSLEMPSSYTKVHVKVKNKGQLTARVKNIVVTGLDNPNISVTYGGVMQNAILNPSDEKEMIIEVKWNETSSVTTASASFKIEMNYEQVTSSMESSGEIPFIKIANKIVDAAEKKHIKNEYNVYNLPADNAVLGISESITGRVIVNEEGKTQASLHDNKYCGLKKYYDNGIDVVTYSERCTPEVADNLIKNGYGEYNDNTNFSGLTYENGAFKRRLPANTEGPSRNNDLAKIDDNKNYHISVEMKNNDTSVRYYAGVIEYDIDKKRIDTVTVAKVSNTLTYLTRDLKDGDTIVYLNNVSNFLNNTDTSNINLGLIFWNYKDSTGYLYPPETYSRNAWQGLYLYTGVDKVNNTITLKDPWNKGTIKSGAKLSQSNGGGWNYVLAMHKLLTSSWQTFENNISNIPDSGYTPFRPAAKYVTFTSEEIGYGALDTDTYYKNIVIEEIR